MSKISQIEIQETSDGELFFEIPPALLEDLGWQENDDVKFIDNKDGSFKIKKVKYETIELDFDDEELLKYMKHAHEKGMSFNQWVEDCLKQILEKLK
jgi:bifunctional DNA-binding transcriptional regulator/antitoxin component of YhaV-PrlF toxin-antitoxin module|tara:strand:+ start:1735 stop:2025 length:291 start_codon:yes stop_codon:yes gene_type:complete